MEDDRFSVTCWYYIDSMSPRVNCLQVLDLFGFEIKYKRSSGGPKDCQAEHHTYRNPSTAFSHGNISWLAVLLVGATARRWRRRRRRRTIINHILIITKIIQHGDHSPADHLVYSGHFLYWTYHVTISRAQVVSSSNSAVFLSWPLPRYCLPIGSQAQARPNRGFIFRALSCCSTSSS